ncbi:DUF1992 domain-containing protein [Stackebrandtia soli]|uniref:DnaJ family domain-containing protein n=1 Tax=Stackebrandtia soli TaxID=1892856 RepID=UPI0039EB8A8E
MHHWESAIDRQIREAAERGAFDNLPGAGKPLRDAGQPLAEDWWLKEWLAREKITGVLPTTLALRKELEDLETTLDALREEEAVRRHLEGLNKRLRAALIGPVDGPPVPLHTVDEDQAVAAWRGRRSG